MFKIRDLIYIGLLSIIMLQLFYICSCLTIETKEVKELVKEDSIAPLNQENLLNELLKQDIEHPDIVLSQAIQECGQDLNSYNARKNNNIFGFRSKAYISHKNKFGYLKFDSWKDCVVYYKNWQTKLLRDGENYYNFLKRIGYAEDSTYNEALAKKVWYIRKKFNFDK